MSGGIYCRDREMVEQYSRPIDFGSRTWISYEKQGLQPSFLLTVEGLGGFSNQDVNDALQKLSIAYPICRSVLTGCLKSLRWQETSIFPRYEDMGSTAASFCDWPLPEEKTIYAKRLRIKKESPLAVFSLHDGSKTRIYFKIHHACVDGVGGMKILKTILSKTPDTRTVKKFEQEKKYEKAIDILKKGVENNSENEDMTLHLASLYDKIDKSEDGFKLIAEILKKNPENPHAMNYVAYYYAEKGIKLEKALTLAKNALKLRPKDAYITDTLGWIHFKMGKLDQALEILITALTLVKDEPVIIEHAGDIYSQMGNRNKALEMYQKAVEFFEDSKDIERVKDKIRKYIVDDKQS